MSKQHHWDWNPNVRFPVRTSISTCITSDKRGPSVWVGAVFLCLSTNYSANESFARLLILQHQDTVHEIQFIRLQGLIMRKNKRTITIFSTWSIGGAVAFVCEQVRFLIFFLFIYFVFSWSNTHHSHYEQKIKLAQSAADQGNVSVCGLDPAVRGCV